MFLSSGDGIEIYGLQLRLSVLSTPFEVFLKTHLSYC